MTLVKGKRVFFERPATIVEGVELGLDTGSVTRGDLTLPIDYNDVGAVDPPAGLVIYDQTTADDYLAAQGATNFKHLDRVYRALPELVAHDVNLSLAAGVHRPSGDADNGSYAWGLTGKIVSPSGRIDIEGPLSSSYTAIVGSFASQLTIDSYVEGVGVDPSVSFTGTPFQSLNLKGRMAVFNTGQVTFIHDHDDNTVQVCSRISPAPTAMWVAKPSAVLRNSLDDASFVGSSTLRFGSGALSGVVSWKDVAIEGFGGNGIIVTGDGASNIVMNRLVVDDRTPYDDFAISPNGRAFQFGGPIGTLGFNPVAYASPAGIGGNDGLFLQNLGSVNLTAMIGCYFGESSSPNAMEAARGMIIRNTVFDDVAELVFVNSKFTFQDFGTGKKSEVRNSTSMVLRNCQVPVEGGFGVIGHTIVLTNMSGPAVRIENQSQVSLKDGLVGPVAGFVDGGGNLDVGIELAGGGNHVELTATTDVTGANGDIRMADGNILSYSDVLNDGPFTDQKLNVVGGL